MRFSRTRPRRDSGDDAILPLTNVVFLLLIFFMLAGRIAAPDALDIRPPESASRTPAQYDGLAVSIAGSGEIALAGEPLSLEALERRAREALAERPDLALRLRADARVEAARVVAVMQTLRAAGGERLQLITAPST